jgi:cation transport regulator
LTHVKAARSLAAEHAAMPYRVNDDLPPRIRAHLPPHAQDIYREAFNHAWTQYGDDPRREEIAHRVAWAAVKRRYRKAGDAWVPI